MTLAIQSATGGAGTGTVNADLAAAHLMAIANLDTGFGLGATAGNLQAITYARTDPGVCPTRLDGLVNTAFGVDPTADIVVLAVGGDFVFGDSSTITSRAGTALPVGNVLNPSTSCLVVYDTSDNNASGYCVARDGTGGTLDLPFPVSALAYHELSHAFRIVTGGLLALTAACDPASPEESAAITDENDMRTQLATLLSQPVVLRDPAIHCGGSCGGGGGGSCCIVASVATGSPLSEQVDALRAVRDRVLRRTDAGYAFFRSLHHAYYGFSPQIATRIAADQRLRETVRVGFVEPLVRMLRLVETCLLEDASDAALGNQLLDELNWTERAATHSLLDRAVALCSGETSEALDDGERWLAELLAERAVPDPHVSWALIEPVLMYRDLVSAARSGGSPELLGTLVRHRVSDWAGEMPISDEWGAYDVADVRRHLVTLHHTVLRTTGSRRRFHERLRERYGNVTAIDVVVPREDFDRSDLLHGGTDG